MSKLLVSVRNLSEAALAFEHGAHIIDAKEPDRGSLGAVTPLIAEEIIKQLSSKTILSFALGELFEHF